MFFNSSISGWSQDPRCLRIISPAILDIRSNCPTVPPKKGCSYVVMERGAGDLFRPAQVVGSTTWRYLL